MSARRPTAVLGLALAAAVAGCESRAQPPACPGAAVATLSFSGELATDAGGCPTIPDGGITFTGTVSYAGDAGYLCLDRPEAVPLAGTRQGDHLTLTAAPVPVTLDACGCPLTLTEQLEGDLLRADGGAATGFKGELSDELDPADGGTAGCEKDGGAACGVPCVARWSITAP